MGHTLFPYESVIGDKSSLNHALQFIVVEWSRLFAVHSNIASNRSWGWSDSLRCHYSIHHGWHLSHHRETNAQFHHFFYKISTILHFAQLVSFHLQFVFG